MTGAESRLGAATLVTSPPYAVHLLTGSLTMTQTTPMTDHWLNAHEVGVRLGVSPRTARRMAERRELTAYKIGGQFRFAVSDLDAYLNRSRRPAVSRFS